MIPWLAAAGFLVLAGCANPTGGGVASAPDSPCVTQCDAAMDTCSNHCENSVDNDLCAQECIDKLQTCKTACE